MRSPVAVIVAIVSPRRPAVAVMPAIGISLVPARTVSMFFCVMAGTGVDPVLSPMTVIPVSLLPVLGTWPVVPVGFSGAG